jgi:hypothetical protein
MIHIYFDNDEIVFSQGEESIRLTPENCPRWGELVDILRGMNTNIPYTYFDIVGEA